LNVEVYYNSRVRADCALREKEILMKRLSVLLASASIMFSAFCQHSTANATADEDAIRRSADEFVDAYDHANAENVAALWAPDGEYMVGHNSVKGRDAIAKLYGEFFRAHPGSKMKIAIESIRAVAPNVVIEKGTASVSESANGPPSASAYTAVHVKQGDKWLMASVQESELPSVTIDRNLKELDWLVGEWTAKKGDQTLTLAADWLVEKHFLRIVAKTNNKIADVPSGTQVIGRDPASGMIISWFFSGDGGYGTGIWQRDGTRYLIQTQGTAGDGTPTAANNLVYRADKDVVSWQSSNRVRGDTQLPDVKEVVFERVQKKK
jgi:uncharacterized protein (TIGR02246 family)